MTSPGQGGGGSDELVTKSDKGGKGVLTDGDVTTKKNYVLYFTLFYSGSYVGACE